MQRGPVTRRYRCPFSFSMALFAFPCCQAPSSCFCEIVGLWPRLPQRVCRSLMRHVEAAAERPQSTALRLTSCHSGRRGAVSWRADITRSRAVFSAVHTPCTDKDHDARSRERSGGGGHGCVGKSMRFISFSLLFCIDRCEEHACEFVFGTIAISTMFLSQWCCRAWAILHGIWSGLDTH